MTRIRDAIERDLGRPVRAGSLGAVNVDRAIVWVDGKRQWGWRVTVTPGWINGSDGASFATTNKRTARDYIARWVEWRQEVLGIDIGSYTLTQPTNF